jgi:hypothetical protein
MTPDDYYMNFAYVSERWLFEFMMNKYSDTHNAEWKTQIQDERRHTLMCLGALKKRTNHFVDDTTYSIEHAIYQDIGGYIPDTVEKFSALSWIVEKRALFLYKMYLKNGKDDLYKKVTKSIINDERKHVRFHNEIITEEHRKIKSIDKQIWKAVNAVYGVNGMFEEEFWKDLFNDSLKEKLNVKIS